MASGHSGLVLCWLLDAAMTSGAVGPRYREKGDGDADLTERGTVVDSGPSTRLGRIVGRWRGDDQRAAGECAFICDSPVSLPSSVTRLYLVGPIQPSSLPAGGSDGRLTAATQRIAAFLYLCARWATCATPHDDRRYEKVTTSGRRSTRHREWICSALLLGFSAYRQCYL